MSERNQESESVRNSHQGHTKFFEITIFLIKRRGIKTMIQHRGSHPLKPRAAFFHHAESRKTFRSNRVSSTGFIIFFTEFREGQWFRRIPWACHNKAISETDAEIEDAVHYAKSSAGWSA